ncbi:SRPBCC domain-containing protein [Streptomyces sp. NPDC002952]|uniref:SRPBCC domain-containing protein n=1 Tax=Streptomyces sp. NPDC002952 TaxID=3364673 RepID=UPI0036C07D1E
MDHEVFVPVPAERLREALADPSRVARAVPGLHQDAGTAPVSGRLKVRVGSHSITYRGALRVAARDDGSYAVEGDATESRGSGSVKLALTLRLTAADGGTTVAFGGGATADGRVEELPADAVASVAARLLDRFAENLGAGTARATEPAEGAGEPASAGDGSSATADGGSAGTGTGTGPGAAPREDASPAAPTPAAPAEDDGTDGADETGDSAGPVPPSVFETDVPPPALDPLAEEELDAEQAEREFVAEGLDGPDAPPAEAAHARRTMIGRSAEEVDHAPPRGRYAPVPAPESGAAGATLRWAAPAAAFALASAIVVSRALRRRR